MPKSSKLTIKNRGRSKAKPRRISVNQSKGNRFGPKWGNGAAAANGPRNPNPSSGSKRRR